MTFDLLPDKKYNQMCTYVEEEPWRHYGPAAAASHTPNPFTPGGELSREANEIVDAIRSGKAGFTFQPITLIGNFCTDR